MASSIRRARPSRARSARSGFNGVDDVRQGKYIEVALHEKDETKAKAEVERMCKELLANTVIENYSYELVAK